MSTDELLKAAAKAAREDGIEGDPRWTALVEGKISAEDRAALEDLARTSRAHDETWQTLQPLDDAARSRITNRILAQLQGEQAGARVIPLPARRPGAAALVAVACAAAIAVLVLRRESPPEVALGPQGDAQADRLEAPVPAYEIALLGGERTLRADPDPAGAPSSVVLGPGSSLEITLRPATAVRGPLEVRGFLIRGGQVRRWDVRADVSEEGAARIAGEREALFPGVPAGAWEITLVVGRPGTLPDGDAALRGSEAQDARWRLFRRKVVLADSAPSSPSSAPPP